MANPCLIEISRCISDPVKGAMVEFTAAAGEVRYARFFALADLNESSVELRRWLGQCGIATDRVVLKDIKSALVDLPKPVGGCVAEVPGWHGGAFVLPSGVFGAGAANVVNLTGVAGIGKWQRSGTLEEWHEKVAGRLKESPVAIFALSLALAGPLLRFTSDTSVVGMLTGKSSLGKSTLAAVCGSVWGGGGESPFVETFEKTPEVFEKAMMRHRDTFLALDETGLLNSYPRKAGLDFHAILMRFSSETTKERYERKQAAATIRGTCLITSNPSAKEILLGANLPYELHHAVRLLEIPVHLKTFPIFEFGTVEPENMATKVRLLGRRARKYAGTAGPAFVARIVADLVESKSEFRSRLRRYIDEGRTALKLSASATGADWRMAEKAAVVYAAGRLAAYYKILPFSREELLAAVQPVWARIHKTALRSVVRDPVPVFLRQMLKVRKDLIDITAARPSMAEATAKAATGFIKHGNGGKVEIWLPTRSFDQLTSNGKAVLDGLEARGLLQREGSGSNAPKSGKRQVYVVVGHDKRGQAVRVRAYKIVARLDALERLARL